MQLNYECIRALLLYFEDNLRVDSHGLPKGLKVKNIDLEKEFPQFSQEEIYYNIRKLVEAGYIKLRKNDVAPRIMIVDEITLAGHEFLDASKNSSNWKKAMEFVKSKGGGITLDVLKALLIQLAKDLLLK